MPETVEKLFQRGITLCDGAMGTMLLQDEDFANRCLEELNLAEPEAVRAVHDQYLQAGAEVVETNTFGANAFRLERAGLRDHVRAINVAGAALAREAVGAMREKGSVAWVAGSVGPLGARLEPHGPLSVTRVRMAFAEQMAALAEGGVDLLMVETMMSMAEAEQALLAAREVAPGLKIAVLVTCDEEANCLDGVSAEIAAARLTEMGADAVGCNCSFGLASVLKAIERMRAVTTLPLIAMPSAGLPHGGEGLADALASPKVMAEFVPRVLIAGASWIGGCCGTTPEHIRAMRRALDRMETTELDEAVKMLEVA